MQKTLIWDIPTRLFHWLIVASLLAQYATVEWLENKVQWHFYIGYFTLFLIVFRIIWGFVGTQHAKFSSFITGPRKVFNYIKTLFNRQSEPAIGHNPLGVRIRHFPITNSGLSITPILIHPITGIMACPISSCGRPQSATGIYLMVCCFLIDSPVRVIR